MLEPIKQQVSRERNGLYETCGVAVRQRMKHSLFRRLKEVGVQMNSQELPFDSADGMVNAQQILRRGTRPI